MINLPRELIYQDREILKDYLAGNELNNALYNAMRNSSKRSRQGLFASYSAWTVAEERSVDTFNNAYYLCILAANDVQACTYFSDYKRYHFSVHAYQMALAILMLQFCRGENVDKVVTRFGKDLKSPFAEVVERFSKAGRAYQMDFSLRLPEPDKLEMDWETATCCFNRGRIRQIIRLWKDYDKKMVVCRAIWQSFRASTRHDLPFVEVNDSFFENMLNDLSLGNRVEKEVESMMWKSEQKSSPKERKPAPKEEEEEPADCTSEPLPAASAGYDDAYWVRKVVDYAKDRHGWLEAKPFHEMLNHLLRGSGNTELFAMVDEIEEHFRCEEKKAQSIEKVGTFINSVNNYHEIKDVHEPKNKRLK